MSTQRVSLTDRFGHNFGRVENTPFETEVARRMYSNIRSWSKVGYNAAVTTEQDIGPWMTGVYVWPTTELTMTIVSSSAQDAPGGTGVSQVQIWYLDSAFKEYNAVVTLNGVGAVTIAANMYRVNNAMVIAGATGNNTVPAGNLTIANGGTTYGYITLGYTRMRQCVWTVPRDNILYINQIAFSVSGQTAAKSMRIITRANYDGLSDRVLQRGLFQPYNEVTLNNSSYIASLIPPTRLPETTDLRVSAVSADTAVVTCSLRGVLERIR